MTEPTLTLAMVEEAIQGLIDQPYLPCPHIVHPRYRGWHLTQPGERVDAYVMCGNLCGWICLTKPAEEPKWGLLDRMAHP